MAKYNIDLRKEFLEVGSAPHTYLGGIRIDEWGRSTVDGLYAGGEAAGGIHGANRLGGLALIDSYVFGLRSGVSEKPSPGWNIMEEEGIEFLVELIKKEANISDAV